MYDFAVIGAGIAGVSVAHFLAQAGKRVAILDASRLNPAKIQASSAAGAFLSPMFGKGDLKSFINGAFADALLFYGKHFAPLLTARGLLRLEKHLDRDFSGLGETMDFPYERRGDGYFLPVGAMIDARGLLRGLSALSDIYDLDVQALHYDERERCYTFSGAVLRQASGGDQDLSSGGRVQDLRSAASAKDPNRTPQDLKAQDLRAKDLRVGIQDLRSKDPSGRGQDLSAGVQDPRAKDLNNGGWVQDLSGQAQDPRVGVQDPKAQDFSAGIQDLRSKDPSGRAQDLSTWAQDLHAKAVVLATGAYPLASLPALDLPALRGVWGERLAVETPARVAHNIAKDVSVSATMADGLVAIGSTHVRSTTEFGLNKERATALLERARATMSALVDLRGARIVDIKCGIRPCSADYYPAAGRVYDSAKILELYPGIRHGARIPEHLLSSYPELYIHTAHGGRGFASAIYTARALADFILHATPLPSRINSARLVYKTLRRAAKL
ncbi:MAG: NAD(P)/FAD-dependent oxidoreductase [Helicobacteraceae bacterium]